MLTVSDKAAEYLLESLTRKQEGMPDALRIVYTEEGYQLTLDNPHEGDHVFEHGGENYLVLDGEVGEALSDATLDIEESPHGVALTLIASDTPPPSKPGAEAQPEGESESEA